MTQLHSFAVRFGMYYVIYKFLLSDGWLVDCFHSSKSQNWNLDILSSKLGPVVQSLDLTYVDPYQTAWWFFALHGSLNVPMFHITQPLGIWSTRWLLFLVMSNIPKMGHLPTPALPLWKMMEWKSVGMIFHSRLNGKSFKIPWFQSPPFIHFFIPIKPPLIPSKSLWKTTIKSSPTSKVIGKTGVDHGSTNINQHQPTQNLPGLVNIQKAIEHGPWNSGFFPLKMVIVHS